MNPALAFIKRGRVIGYLAVKGKAWAWSADIVKVIFLQRKTSQN